jgi:hypothetical protein
MTPLDKSWVIEEMLALRARRKARPPAIRRAKKIAMLKRKADELRKMAGGNPASSDRYWRFHNAAVSCALLAALAEHHDAPPPDYEDGLADCFSYSWANAAQTARLETFSLYGSPAQSIAEFGGSKGAF